MMAIETRLYMVMSIRKHLCKSDTVCSCIFLCNGWFLHGKPRFCEILWEDSTNPIKCCDLDQWGCGSCRITWWLKLQKGPKSHISWLVVKPPLLKISVNWDDDIPFPIYGKMKVMFHSPPTSLVSTIKAEVMTDPWDWWSQDGWTWQPGCPVHLQALNLP